jgi:SagB-type dehydrogenase family enzyme
MMKKFIFLFGLILLPVVLSGCVRPNTNTTSFVSGIILKLPEPQLKSDVSLEESLQNRRSIRQYSNTPLKLEDVSQILWSSQGITSEYGWRTAPSAGGLYPLEVYLIAGSVYNLNSGVYKYISASHSLTLFISKDLREELAGAALDQIPVKIGAIDIVISAVYERTTQKYGERGIRYTHIEAGHAAQNILLQSTALSLGAVPIGAFDDNLVKKLLGMPEDENPLYIIPVGNLE